MQSSPGKKIYFIIKFVTNKFYKIKKLVEKSYKEYQFFSAHSVYSTAVLF